MGTCLASSARHTKMAVSLTEKPPQSTVVSLRYLERRVQVLRL